MPAPARTSTAAVVAAGRAILERDGPDALPVRAVGGAGGVKAPPLYKRVVGRDGLVRLVVDQVALELAAEVDGAVRGADPAADLRAVADTFRRFARRNPAAYPLLFAARQGGMAEEARDRWSEAVRRVSAALAGEDHALSGARMVVAWAHGFV